MIKSLQSLRGIFAFMILLHHCGVGPATGHSAVCFFLMLSGFLMAMHHQDNAAGGVRDYGRYMYGRIRRIYPMHLVFLVLYVLTFTWEVSACGYRVLCVDALLLQSWVPTAFYAFSYNGVAWFLSTLMFCYAMFPFVIPAFSGSGGRTRAAISGLLVVVLYGVFFSVADGVDRYWCFYINPLFRFIDFFLGIVLWKFVSPLVSGCGNSLSRRVCTVLEIGAVAVFAASMALFGYFYADITLAVYWWAPVALLIGVFAVTDSFGGLVSALLHRRPLIAFGNMSMYFFLCHQIVIKVLGAYFGVDSQLHRIVAGFIISVAVSIVASRFTGFVSYRSLVKKIS